MDVGSEKVLELIDQYFPFGQFREHQKDAIYQTVMAYLDGKQFVVIESPTGSGKSVIAYTASKVIQHINPMTERRKAIMKDGGGNPGPYSIGTVQTRSLQVQYNESFSDMPLLWSSANYECAKMPFEPEARWGSWQCNKMKCPEINRCEYYHAIDEFKSSDIGITNYAFFLHQNMFYPAIVTIDEAHNLEEALCEWMKVSLSKKFMFEFFDQLQAWSILTEEQTKLGKEHLQIILTINPNYDGWLDTVRESGTILEELSTFIYNGIEFTLKNYRDSGTPMRTEMGKRMSRFSDYFRNLRTKLWLLTNTETEWVISDRDIEEGKPLKDTATVHLKPLYINELSSFFFKKGEFFILMSATICGHESMMKYLGVPSESYHYIGVPSTIPLENRPVYVIRNAGKLVYRNKEEMLPKFVNYMDCIIEAQFQGVRGIIHSVSYENATFIKEHSKFSKRMEFPENTEQLTEVIRLLEEKSDTIVVSPSVVEGLDLRDDLCRFSFFFKTPWASLGDEWVKRRKDDETWYARNAAVKIVQGSGRGTRSNTDHSITVVLDASFLNIWFNHDDVLPDWFKEAVELIKI